MLFSRSRRTNRAIGLNIVVFFLPPCCGGFLFLGDQTNARMALSHGDPDPVRFRWLIPFSALQVRLGNTAGKSQPPCTIHPQSHTFLYFCLCEDPHRHNVLANP